MTTRRAEPVARRDRLTTRRAPTQRSAARTAEAVFIPPGRTAPRTRHHQAFIPRPGPHSTWQAPTTIAAVRAAHAGPGTDNSRPPAALWAHRPNAYRCRKPDSSSRPANPPEWAFGAGPLPSTPGPVATSDSALGAPGSVERLPPELTGRRGPPACSPGQSGKLIGLCLESRQLHCPAIAHESSRRHGVAVSGQVHDRGVDRIGQAAPGRQRARLRPIETAEAGRALAAGGGPRPRRSARRSDPQLPVPARKGSWSCRAR